MDMNTDRTINFGKYKGTPIKQLILEHIGYIYWCLSNLEWFKLNADEQALYDAVAIANIKHKIDLVFPVRELAKFIVDKEKSPWISVEDDLPCNHEEMIQSNFTDTVLVLSNNGCHEVEVTSMCVIEGKWKWNTLATVLYWMPIPKPLKE